MSIFDNKDFYPTPESVLDYMQIEAKGKKILEPSAGSGNILKYLRENGALKLYACESSDQLAEISKSLCDVFICNDFLKVQREDISHIDMIVANPPFSVGVHHVLHMWEIAPAGCEIITLINHDNFTAPFGKTNVLKSIIEQYGTIENLGDVFNGSERSTKVNVGLIKLYRPANESSAFEGFFMDDEHHVNTTEGIIQPNKIRDLVERYVDAIKCFSEFETIQNKMNHILKPVGVQPLKAKIERERTGELQMDDFVANLQKVFWSHIFKEMNLGRFFTSQVREKINQFSEQQQKVPFTMKNIYRMVEIIHGTKDNILNEALVEAVDNFTKHSHENRFMVEGWKTNSGYMLNKKFITGFPRDRWHDYPQVAWGSHEANRMDDLVRVLCNLTGKDFTSIGSIYDFFKGVKEEPENYSSKYIYKEFGVWYEWAFFEIKVFKKGSLHVKFKNKEIWAMLNQAYAKSKGQVLPSKI